MVENSTNIAVMDAKASPTSFSYQSALPIPNSRLAMLLFLSTEVMFFTAIIGAYFILRIPYADKWPVQEVVHVDLWLGILNTIVLLGSCVSVRLATRSAMVDRAGAAKLWLVVTVGLSTIFLGIKGFEYYTKYEHGLYPTASGPLIYEQADQNYLSRCVAGAQDITAEMESRVGTDFDEERLGDLKLIKSGIIEWTQHKVGISSDRAARDRSIEIMAHQIKPLGERGEFDEFIANETKEVETEKAALQAMLDETEAKLKSSQSKLKEIDERKAETDTAELQEAFAEESRRAEDFTEKIGDVRKEMVPLKNRLKAVGILEGSDSGINELYGVKLPMVVPAGKAWANTYFLLTGFHLIHMLIGLGVLLVWLFVRFGKSKANWLENFGLYWHFVDFVWMVIFVIIYLT